MHLNQRRVISVVVTTLSESLALGEQPLFERRLLECQAFEELPAVAGRGPLERGRRVLSHPPLELDHVNVGAARVQRDRSGGNEQDRGLRGDGLPDREEGLTEASARLRFWHAPQSKKASFSRGWDRREREKGEERVRVGNVRGGPAPSRP
jgi:hypothetical protein